MLDSVLIANRGEIARRVIAHRPPDGDQGHRRVLRRRRGPAVRPRGRRGGAHRPGRRPPGATWTPRRSSSAARKTGAAAVHPGYGFLAENAGFARQVIDAGLTWVGPDPAAIEQMGDKIRARNLMERPGVPVAPGSREPRHRRRRGHGRGGRGSAIPVMVKAAAGGGGIGMSAAAEPRRAAGGVRDRAVPGRALLRLAGDPARALRAARPARRGADPRPGRRPGARARRARLLGAAPAPEGGRGDPVPGRLRRAARADAGRRRPGRGGGRLPGRRDRRVPGGHRRPARSSSWR